MRGEFTFVIWEPEEDFPADKVSEELDKLLVARVYLINTDFDRNVLVIYSRSLVEITDDEWDFIGNRAFHNDTFGTEFDNDCEDGIYLSSVEKIHDWISRVKEMESLAKADEIEEAKQKQEEKERALYEKLRVKFEPKRRKIS